MKSPIATAAPLALLITALFFSTLPALAQDEPVAIVNGQEITLEELEASVADQLDEIERQRRKLLVNAIAPLVDQRVLDAEAKQRGVDREKLIAAEIDAKLSPVTDAEVDSWYEQNQARVRGNKEQLLPQIKTFLEQEARRQLYGSFLRQLRAKHDVKVLFEVDRIELSEEGATLKGDDAAPVTIVEFSDFQCPSCRHFNPTLEQVLETYGDSVRVVFRQFPLRQIHPQAQKAAEAALCARDQDKFWDLHDAMFADQRALKVEKLKETARKIGLDGETFDQCLDSGQHAEQVQADLDHGRKSGASGTPTVFVNGREVNPGKVPSFDQMANVIDDELARRGASETSAP